MDTFRTLLLLGLVLVFNVSGAQTQDFTKYPGDEIDEVDVPYVPTPDDVVAAMLTRAEAGPGDIHYDLGSGDGRIVIAAVRDFNVDRGVGVDLDPARVRAARENAQLENITDRAKFFEGDIFEFDFSEATVLTLYLLPEVNLKLRPRILNELAPGTRVVSHAFNMDDWDADAVEEIGLRTIYYWVVPAKVEGEWEWTMSGDPYRAVIEQKFQNLTGEFHSVSTPVPLEFGVMKGNVISFETRARDEDGQTQAMLFEGTVDGDVINAEVFVGGRSFDVTARRVQ